MNIGLYSFTDLDTPAECGVSIDRIYQVEEINLSLSRKRNSMRDTVGLCFIV
jgi:hypothetical protein